MDAYEKARAKYEKNRERQARPPLVPEKAEEVKVEVKKEVKKTPPMVVHITGPLELKFELDYAGTLLGSQVNVEYLMATLKKQLLPIGKVR